MSKDKSRDTTDEPLRHSGDGASGADTSGEDAAAASRDVSSTDLDRSPRKSRPRASKAVLPAFGFAADLLRQSARGSDDDSTVSAEAAAVTPLEAASADVDDLAAGHLGAGDLDPAAPDRVFDFADQIARGSRQQADAAKAVRLGTFVTFDLADERFAIPVDPVRQVVRVSAITRVPHAPRPIRGVTNLRGRVIPVIDLRLRIGLPEGPIERSTRVIAVASKGRLIGLLVDAVHQVMHLDLNQVQPPPDDVMTVQSDYIEGVYGEGRDLLMLLDIDRALTIKDAA